MSREVVRAVLKNIGYFTQLGFSIAFPMIACTMGALWLRERLGLGSWVVMAGLLLGVLSGISCFLNFAGHMIRQSRKDDRQDGSRD